VCGAVLVQQVLEHLATVLLLRPQAMLLLLLLVFTCGVEGPHQEVLMRLVRLLQGSKAETHNT
jgi:hypothetical protein